MRPGCERWLESISRRLDGEISPEEVGPLEEHLAGCPDCRRLEEDLVDDQRRLVAVVRQRASVASLEGLEDSVLTAIRTEMVASPGQRFARMAVVAAAAVVVLWAGVTRPIAPAVVPEAEPIPVAFVDTRDLGRVAAEAEVLFYFCQNSVDFTDLESVRVAIATNDLVSRFNTLRMGAEVNLEQVEDLDNVVRNLRVVQEASPETLGMVKVRLANYGAIVSCQNLRTGAGMPIAASSFASSPPNNLVSSLPEDGQLFWSHRSRIEAGDVDGAIEIVDLVLERFPSGAWADDALFAKGDILAGHANDADSALLAYNTLIVDYPESPLVNDSRINAAQLETNQHAWTDAHSNLSFVQRNVQNNQLDRPTNRLWNLSEERLRSLERNMAQNDLLDLARQLCDEGQPLPAGKLLRDLQDRYPDSATSREAWLLLAEIEIEEGDLEAAREILVEHLGVVTPKGDLDAPMLRDLCQEEEARLGR